MHAEFLVGNSKTKQLRRRSVYTKDYNNKIGLTEMGKVDMGTIQGPVRSPPPPHSHPLTWPLSFGSVQAREFLDQLSTKELLGDRRANSYLALVCAPDTRASVSHRLTQSADRPSRADVTLQTVLGRCQGLTLGSHTGYND
jgi:hypothetical protein